MKEQIYFYNQYYDSETTTGNLLTIGKSMADESLNTKRSNPQYYCFEFVTGGQGIFEVGSVQYPVSAGHLFILYKGVPHAYRTAGKYLEKIWCEFDGPIFEAMLNIFLPDQPPTIYCPAAAEEMKTIYSWAEQGLSDESGGDADDSAHHAETSCRAAPKRSVRARRYQEMDRQKCF